MEREMATIEIPEDAPLVSCVMPTRNRRDFLLQAIRLFQRQDYPRKELIVLEDGASSADLIPDDPAIRYVQLSRRTTIGRKRNIGCEMAAGRIIAQWDDDDWYADHRLSYQVAPLLSGETHMTAVEGSLYLDLGGGELWHCDEAVAKALFPLGCFPSSLVYWRVVWEKLYRYPNKSLGEVGSFVSVPSRRGAMISVLPNERTYVYVRHRGNTWREFSNLARKTRVGWSVREASEVFSEQDIAFYRRFAALPAAAAAAPEAATAPTTAAGDEGQGQTSSTSEDMPLVTCILPVRGEHHLVARAMDCFLRQDYPNAELVIVDDGEPALDLPPEDDRIRVVKLDRRASLGEKRNRGCAVARGKIIAHFDPGAVHAPGRLSRQVGALLDGNVHMTAFAENGPLAGTLVYWRAVWEQLTAHPRVTEHADEIFVKVARCLTAKFEAQPDEGLVVHDRTSSDIDPPSVAPSDARSPDAPRRPMITCTMPTHGRAVFVPQSVHYFQRQDYPNKELVILDDSKAELDIELPEAENVVYVHLRQRLALGAKRNICCEIARGDIIAQWDDDDWFAPTRLSVQAAPLLSGKADITTLRLTRMLVLERGEALAGGRRTADGYLVFWRAVWQELAKYGNGNLHECTQFFERARGKGARMVVLPDADQIVCLRHRGNTWRTDAAFRRGMHRVGLEVLIPPEDRGFYLGLMGKASATETSESSSKTVCAPSAPPVTIALLVPVTSRGRQLSSVVDTDLVRRLLRTFVETATWDERTRYRVYVGYDKGDPFYDDALNRDALANVFDRMVGERAAELVMHGCEGTAHAPMWVWNELFRLAYEDGCDWFYQIGDDIEIMSAGWADAFQRALTGNESAPGVGVAGPLDVNNKSLLTQSFVSRRHMEIFGTYYPRAFKNWWGDNWIGAVYAPRHVFWCQSYLVRNAGGPERYKIDRNAEKILGEEVSREREKLEAWIAQSASSGREEGRRIIAFSLWGTQPRYTVGAIRNAELAQEIYPGWTCRFYVATSVPEEILAALAALPNTEIVRTGLPGDWTGMFWRFLAAADSDVDVVLSRDTDSRLSWRERAAVDEWLRSTGDFHIMRDHPSHNVHILGGMWGARNGLLRDMVERVRAYRKSNRYGVDQDFLRAQVYPLVQGRACVHDEFFERRPFPTPRNGFEFVGEPFDEADRPLDERHTRNIAAALSVVDRVRA
ncbi:glycosyltransferase [Polyangium sp. 6x1]|uniref:glycosyltransferase family 2 protein n=1 Tax=Polyangium sp. 6x1 TaxID=3042689 RepID=UPI002482DBDA|nr:glycosyltransferase [Polyangium sp. 6x1]MDI1443847.1 glycosyltransferase [Polyangium sp. 6x1]